MPRLLPALAALLLGAAHAEPLLTKGGSLIQSKFCGTYRCTLLGTLPTNALGQGRAYALKAEPSLGVVTRVKGGAVTGAALVVLDPAKVSDARLLKVFTSVLPDFQKLSLGARHAFRLNQLCFTRPTAKKAVKVAGQAFTFRCVYDDKTVSADVRKVWKVGAAVKVLNIAYTR